MSATNEFPSLAQIKKTLPSRCFVPNLLTSFLYLGRQIFFCVGFALFFHFIRTTWIGSYSMCIVLYALIQGTAFWGLFVIGHDCGHDSFSAYPWINWCIGNVVHSVILTPYEAWRISHRSHHNNTCHLQRDEIFYPNPPVSHGLFVCTTWGGAWFWYILFKNAPGRHSYFYYLFSSTRRQLLLLVLSFLVLAGTLALLFFLVITIGWYTIIVYYGTPLFVFASWLVMVTFLHHNDDTTPWYTNETWTYVKGALSSVDRDYGFFVNTLSNSIHFASSTPFVSNNSSLSLRRSDICF